MAKQQRVESIHLLRAPAALMVVFHHSSNAVKGLPTASLLTFGGLQPGRLGAAGVDVFFVISGFVMALTLADPEHRNRGTAQFLSRRIIRVVPLYWLFTTVNLLLYQLPGAYKHNPLTLVRVLESYLFFPSYAASGRVEPILGPGWTLFYEMFFYAIIAICISRSFRSTLSACTAILCACVLAGAVFHPTSTALRFWSDPLLLEFVMGMFAAVIYITGKTRSAAWMYTLLTAAAVLWAINLVVPSPLDMRLFFWGVPALVLILAATSFESLHKFRLWRSVSIVADASYAIYITHIFFGLLVEIVVKRAPAGHLPHAVILVFLCVGLSVSFGIACHYFIERPLTAWLLSLRAPQRVIAAGPPSAAADLTPAAPLGIVLE